MSPHTMRKVDELFTRYGESHRNPTNKAIHWICVPLITWSLLAALWAWTPLAAYATMESEQKFRALAESATDAILSADGRGNITYANAAAVGWKHRHHDLRTKTADDPHHVFEQHRLRPERERLVERAGVAEVVGAARRARCRSGSARPRHGTARGRPPRHPGRATPAPGARCPRRQGARR